MLVYMHRYEVYEAIALYLSKNLGADRELFNVIDVDYEHVKLTYDEATGKTNTSDRQRFEFDECCSLIFTLEELPREG